MGGEDCSSGGGGVRTLVVGGGGVRTVVVGGKDCGSGG